MVIGHLLQCTHFIGEVTRLASFVVEICETWAVFQALAVAICHHLHLQWCGVLVVDIIVTGEAQKFGCTALWKSWLRLASLCEVLPVVGLERRWATARNTCTSIIVPYHRKHITPLTITGAQSPYDTKPKNEGSRGPVYELSHHFCESLLSLQAILYNLQVLRHWTLHWEKQCRKSSPAGDVIAADAIRPTVVW